MFWDWKYNNLCRIHRVVKDHAESALRDVCDCNIDNNLFCSFENFQARDKGVQVDLRTEKPSTDSSKIREITDVGVFQHLL